MWRKTRGMSNYLRPRRPGASIYFTVALAVRGSGLLVDQVALLRRAVAETRARRPFRIDAWVVLPDHMHCIWTLPEGDADYSTRWGAIKARFTRAVRDSGRVGFHPTVAGRNGGSVVGWNPTLQSPSKLRKGDAGIWQRRFWEHHIRNPNDHDTHLRACWFDPVKHGLVARPQDWPLSSVHRDIRRGTFRP